MPILLAQRRFPGQAISNAKILIYFSYKYTEAVLSNTALGNCYGLKLPKMLIAVSEKKYSVIYYNFRHTSIPYCDLLLGNRIPLGVYCAIKFQLPIIHAPTALQTVAASITPSYYASIARNVVPRRCIASMNSDAQQRKNSFPPRQTPINHLMGRLHGYEE